MRIHLGFQHVVLMLASLCSLDDAAADVNLEGHYLDGSSIKNSFFLDSAIKPGTTTRLTKFSFDDLYNSTKNTTATKAATATAVLNDTVAVGSSDPSEADAVSNAVGNTRADEVAHDGVVVTNATTGWVVELTDEATGEVASFTVDKDDVIVDEAGGTMALMLNNSASTVVLKEDEETGKDFSWAFQIMPSPLCLGSGWYCIPVSKFYHLPEFSMDPTIATEEQQQAMKEAYIKYMQEELSMYTPGISEAIANALVERFTTFKNEEFMVVNVEGAGASVMMYGVGVVVEDIADISYIKGEFTADLKIYVSKLNGGDPFPTINKATSESWVTKNQTSVVQSDGILKLLDDEYFTAKDKVDPDDILISDGRCNDAAMKSMVPLSMKEFKKDMIRIVQSPASATPIADAEGNIIFLQLHNAKIKFQPVNSEFFPFQVSLLDIKISGPPVPMVIGKPVVLSAYCILGPFTGLKAPMPSLPDEGELTLIPSIKVVGNAPWFNSGNHHMHLKGTGYGAVEENQPDKITRIVNFRVVYYNGSIVTSWMVLIPFLFAAFTTQLQWFILQAETCEAKSMVTAVLLIQSLINSQKPLTGTQNVATQTLYITYILTGIYVLTVALMTFINIAKGSGRIEFLVNHQQTIFSYMRLAGLLMTPMYLPVLFFHTDTRTGEQEHYPWMWPLVGSLCAIAIVSTMLVMPRKKEATATTADVGEEAGAADLSKKGVKSLTVEEVKLWVTHSEQLLEGSRLTKDDLPQIAHKFADARIDGSALVRIAIDPHLLVTNAGLNIGDAMAFADAFEALTDQGDLVLEVDVAPRRRGFGATKKSWQPMRMGNDGTDK